LIIYSNCVLLKLWIYGNISTYIQPRIGSKTVKIERYSQINEKNLKDGLIIPINAKKRVVFVMKLDDEQYSFLMEGLG